MNNDLLLFFDRDDLLLIDAALHSYYCDMLKHGAILGAIRVLREKIYNKLYPKSEILAVFGEEYKKGDSLNEKKEDQ